MLQAGQVDCLSSLAGLLGPGLETPISRRPGLRTVWLVETGKLAPRFITAYPLPACSKSWISLRDPPPSPPTGLRLAMSEQLFKSMKAAPATRLNSLPLMEGP